MKKTLSIAAAAVLVSLQAFASYYVVLKDGTIYKAKAKPAIANGKAVINLENGQSLLLDPNLIDNAKSEEQTRSGLGNAKIFGTDPAGTNTAPQQQKGLGSAIKLRQPANPQPNDVQQSVAPAPAPGTGSMSTEVLEKFERAYENVGIYEHKVSSAGARAIRCELTADTEERVLNAISATSFLLVRNAGVGGAQIDTVELNMKTTTGGQAGKFQMNRADATALDNKTMTREEYFVRRVQF